MSDILKAIVEPIKINYPQFDYYFGNNELLIGYANTAGESPQDRATVVLEIHGSHIQLFNFETYRSDKKCTFNLNDPGSIEGITAMIDNSINTTLLATMSSIEKEFSELKYYYFPKVLSEIALIYKSSTRVATIHRVLYEHANTVSMSMSPSEAQNISFDLNTSKTDFLHVLRNAFRTAYPKNIF